MYVHLNSPLAKKKFLVKKKSITLPKGGLKMIIGTGQTRIPIANIAVSGKCQWDQGGCVSIPCQCLDGSQVVSRKP